MKYWLATLLLALPIWSSAQTVDDALSFLREVLPRCQVAGVNLLQDPPRDFSVGGTSIYIKRVERFGTFEHSIDFSGAIVSVEPGYPEGETYIYVKCGLPSCYLVRIDGEVRRTTHDSVIACGREMNPRVLRALQLWMSSHPKKSFKF